MKENAQDDNLRVNNEEEDKWKLGLLVFKNSTVEKDFLNYYYKHLTFIAKLGLLIMVGANIVFFILDLINYIRIKNQFLIIIMASRIVHVLFVLAIVLPFFIPKCKQMNKKLMEIMMFILISSFILVSSLRLLTNDEGPTVLTTLMGATFFLFRLRIGYIIMLTLIATISFAAVTWSTVMRSQLGTSALPYLRVATVFVTGMVFSTIIYVLERYLRKLFVIIEKIRITMESTEEELERSQILLENILPVSFIDYAKKLRSGFIQKHDDISVLFSDLVNFTSFSSTITASRLFALLNRHFQEFDRLSELLKIEKVKTIGDAYFCVAFDRMNGRERCVTMGFCMIESLKKINEEQNEDFNIRIGVSNGPGTLCVLGNFKLTFDGFGPSVNEAQHLEETSKSNCVHVSQSIYNSSKELFSFEADEESNTYFLKECLIENPTSEKLASLLNNSEEELIESQKKEEIDREEDKIGETNPKVPGTTNIEKLPLIVSAQNCKQFATDVTNMTNIDFDQYVNFIETNQDIDMDQKLNFEEDEISLPKLSIFTTLFRKWEHNKSFLNKSYQENTLYLFTLGAVNFITCVFTTICGYATIYFEDSTNVSWYYTYGVAMACVSIYHLIITLIYLIPPIRKSIIMGLIFITHLFIINIGFNALCMTIVNETFYSNFAISHNNIVYIILITTTIVPFFLKVLAIGLLFPLPLLIVRSVFNGFDATLMINIIIITILRVLIAYFYNFVIARVFEAQKRADLKVNILKEKFERNQALLFSSLPREVVERITSAVAKNSQPDNSNSNSKIVLEEEEVIDEVSHSTTITHSIIESISKSRARHMNIDENAKALICDDIPYTNVMFIKLCLPKSFEESHLGIHILNDLFGWFDLIAEEFNIVKIKSIGVTYIVMSEYPDKLAHAALVYRRVGLKLVKLYQKSSDFYPLSPPNIFQDVPLSPSSPKLLLGPMNTLPEDAWNSSSISLKIGLQCGSLSAGILGTRKYLYDIFGDTVNVAARMCTLAQENHIQMTKAFSEQLSLPSFVISKREAISVKGKGNMVTYYLDDDGSLTGNLN